MIRLDEKTCDKIFVGVYVVCFCVVSFYMMYTNGSEGETNVSSGGDSKLTQDLTEEIKEVSTKLEIKVATVIKEDPIKNEDPTKEEVINEGGTKKKDSKNVGLKGEYPKHSGSYKLTLWISLVEDFVENNSKCLPDHENKIAKSPKPAEDNDMVVHISILLLQTSLIWAIVDFVDRYLKREKKKTERAPLNRTCSLADITLMRHQRRESMRKEYSLDLSHGRMPMRSFETDYGLYRRCSLPIGPRELKPASTRKESLDIAGFFNKRRMTIDSTTTDVPTLEHKRSHMRLLHRH